MRLVRLIFFTLILTVFLSKNILALDCSTPAASLKTFQSGMDEYLSEEPGREEALETAISCFELDKFPAILRKEVARESAYLIKEILDRSWSVQWEDIPASPNAWTIPNTKIEIIRKGGEEKKVYLFSYDTLLNVRKYYNEIKDKPYLSDTGGTGYMEPWYSRYSQGWLKIQILGMRAWQWLGFFIILLTGYVFKPVIRQIIRWMEKLVHRWLLKREIKGRTGLGLPLTWFTLIGYYYMGIYALRIEGVLLRVLIFLLQFAVSAIIVWFAYRFSEYIDDYFSENLKAKARIDDQMSRILTKLLKAFIIITGVLMGLQNLGINIVSLMAGLGLGGLALALAAKDTAANFFGSLMIMMDRPFKIGDWVSVSEGEGVIEDVGIRSTRIRTFYNSVISVPNSIMAAEKIDNLGARQFRRVKTTLNVTYGTRPEKIEVFMEGIKKIIQANPVTKKEGYYVTFSGFGAHSLDILLYFFLEVPDWAEELTHRQNIYLEILRLAEDLKVEFAFPTQSIFVEKPGKGSPRFTPAQLKNLEKIAGDYGPKGKKSKPKGGGLYTPPHQE